MVTKIEDSNLAHIGSEQDQKARKAAAETEAHWEGAGQKVGIEIWRVENTRDENDNPKFGINAWPKRRYGEFYKGDSYVILQTTKDEEDESLQWDIYFWIGSESSQDEYGVAAYKANELDDLLGDAPIQHREVEKYESDQFMECFPKGIKYLKGGVDSGFRQVTLDDEEIRVPTRLFHVRKTGKVTRCFEVPAKCDSLNQGDAFVLDGGNTVYSWFGTSCSPFEKSKTAEIAHNIAMTRGGHAHTEIDVQDDNEGFWEKLGGKGPIKEADDYTDDDVPQEKETQVYVVSDSDSFLTVTKVEAKLSSLVSDDVCLVDTGKVLFVWVGKGSTQNEQEQAMMKAQANIKQFGREKNTQVVRVLEGQERRCRGFKKAFK
eukprot:CAMPEP_0184856320 /NCGR_PEP_ID=MMETSP0580-20130426/1513_1 /TAXON_ID=1118495 /ORGANISM="Dactyliosolen fragilissimus" /LENGTH=374 /DNA_ID=CAMNT_0027351297 /DNA_START=56 /DNA_END=1180 /DNA_ORIENTATION=-